MVEQEIKVSQRQFFEIFPQPKEQKGDRISSLIKGITELKYDFKDVDVTCKEKVPFTYEMVFEKKKYQLLASSGKMVSKNLQNRFKNSWEGAKVKPVAPPDEIFAPEKTIVSDVILKKKSALPISFSQTGELMKSNEPLSSLVGVAKTLSKNEAFMVQYLVVPLKNQMQVFQKAMLQNVADEIKNGASEDLVGKGEQLLRAVGEDLNNTLTDVLDALFEQPIPKPKNAKPMTETASNRTKLDQMASKLSGDLIKVRIRVFVKASNPTRRSELMYEVLTALKTVEGYNRFALTKLTPLKQKPQLIHRQFNHMRSIENLNLLSSKELMTLLSPPSDKLLKNTPQIRQIESEQTPLPSDFFQGIIPFGVTDPLNPRLIYQPTRNLDVFMLPKILLGPPGSGKTTYLIWYVLGLRKMKHNVFIFDYIKNSELTKEIMEALPEDAYEIWDFSDNDFISKFSLSYEESYFEWTQEDFQTRFDIADRIKDHIEELLDALNDGQALNLSSQMKRTLGAVAKAVFVHRGQTLYDFYQVLTDYDVRMKFLKRGLEDKNAEGESILDEDDVKELIRLNETDRVKNPDTNEWEEIENGKTNLRMIESISNRMYVFFKNNRIKRIAKNPVTNDFDFYRLFKQGKIVMIRTPQSVFSEEIRASIVAFLTLKIWLVKEAGKFEGIDDETPMPCPENPKRRLKDLYCTHMIYDEIHQIKPTLSFVCSKIKEFRKFRVCPMLTSHNLDDFGQANKQNFESCQPTYMFLSRPHQKSIEFLEKQFRPLTVDEILALPKYYSANIVSTEKEIYSFTCKSLGSVEDAIEYYKTGKLVLPSLADQFADINEEEEDDWEYPERKSFFSSLFKKRDKEKAQPTEKLKPYIVDLGEHDIRIKEGDSTSSSVASPSQTQTLPLLTSPATLNGKYTLPSSQTSTPKTTTKRRLSDTLPVVKNVSTISTLTEVSFKKEEKDEKKETNVEKKQTYSPKFSHKLLVDEKEIKKESFSRETPINSQTKKKGGKFMKHLEELEKNNYEEVVEETVIELEKELGEASEEFKNIKLSEEEGKRLATDMGNFLFQVSQQKTREGAIDCLEQFTNSIVGLFNEMGQEEMALKIREESGLDRLRPAKEVKKADFSWAGFETLNKVTTPQPMKVKINSQLVE